MKNKKILFIIHRLYFKNIAKKGGIDRILTFLARQNQTTSIEHPFESIHHPSFLTSKRTTYEYMAKLKAPFIWLEEIFINIFWILKDTKKYHLAIGSDPLNFFSCYLLKKLGRVGKTQFHSTDYSPIRFKNKLLNFFYQYLYRFSLRHADYITVVSQRMLKNALPHTVFLLPNSPSFHDIDRVPIIERRKKTLVLTVGLFKNQVDLDILLDCLEILKSKDPEIMLHIIGHVGDDSIDTFYKKKLHKNVVFHGILPYEKTIALVAQSTIGITCYKKEGQYMYYGDSLKIREYAAAGLPIVCDNVYATSEEVRQYDAGFVYTTPQEMVASINQLIENRNLYKQKSDNAINWAKMMDQEKILRKLYNRLLC